MFIVDAHQDIATTLAATGRDFGARDERYSLSLPGLREGGVGLVCATLFDPDCETDAPSAADQVRLYGALAARFPDAFVPVRDAAALDALPGSGRTGFVLLLEGADPLREAADLEGLHRDGVRVAALTWNHANRFAGGMAGTERLTAAGRDLLAAMEALGVVLDVSHLNDASFDDCLEAYGGAVAASHSNARAVADHPRNLTDAQILALAARGGVVGLNFYRGFLVPKGEAGRPARIDDVLRHAERVLSLAGPRALGLGTDLDGGFGPADAPMGCARAEDLGALAAALAGLGLSAEEVEAVLGGNWLRLLRGALSQP